jgi:hypothetical protein
MSHVITGPALGRLPSQELVENAAVQSCLDGAHAADMRSIFSWLAPHGRQDRSADALNSFCTEKISHFPKRPPMRFVSLLGVSDRDRIALIPVISPHRFHRDYADLL